MFANYNALKHYTVNFLPVVKKTEVNCHRLQLKSKAQYQPDNLFTI